MHEVDQEENFHGYLPVKVEQGCTQDQYRNTVVDQVFPASVDQRSEQYTTEASDIQRIHAIAAKITSCTHFYDLNDPEKGCKQKCEQESLQKEPFFHF